MRQHRRRTPLILLILTIVLISTTAIADTSNFKCDDGPGCIDERVNFGTAKIKCTDINGDVLSDWVCEYEMEYSCRDELTGEVRKGGYDPQGTSLCSELCGPCDEGWEK